MKSLVSYIKYLVYVLMGISALMGLLYYTGAISEGVLLGWAYVLVILAAVTSILFPVINIILNPKKAITTFIGVGALGLIILISYLLGSGEELYILGYTGADNVASTLKLADMGLFSTYALFFGAFFAIVFTEIISVFK